MTKRAKIVWNGGTPSRPTVRVAVSVPLIVLLAPLVTPQMFAHSMKKALVYLFCLITTFVFSITVVAQGYSPPNLANAAYTNGPFVISSNLVGQCTWYAYGRIQEVGLISSNLLASLPNQFGGTGIFRTNASGWVADAVAAGIPTGSTPQVGALAVWTNLNHVAFVESVSNNTTTVTECNNKPTNGLNVVVGGAYVVLRSTMNTNSTTNIVWTNYQFSVMSVLGGPVTTNNYQWFQLTDGSHTGYVAWLRQDLSGPAETSGLNNYWWNITQFKKIAASPWWTSVSPTYIYLTTNIFSPTVSYLYSDGAAVSPVVSYQYYEWPGSSILNLRSSPVVSYYYQFPDAPVLTIIQTNRTPMANEITPTVLLPSPSSAQLEIFTNGAFKTNVNLNPNAMTIVLTHGWNDSPNSWASNMAALIMTNLGASAPNIVAWNWSNAAMSSLSDPKQAGGRTPTQGIALGQALLNALGQNYSQKIHFVGHSFGTLVNAYAANFLQGTNWAAETASSTPWPATNMLMTLFDEAEVGVDKDFNLNSLDLAALAAALLGLNDNYLNLPSSFYHPLPEQFAWADNYVSAFGLLHSNAANVILTNGFPTDAPDLKSWLNELIAFHGYPIQWYDETIQTNNSPMGFNWSFLWSVGDPAFTSAPNAGSVYVQAFKSSPWDLTLTNWNYGTNFLYQRFQEYRNEFGNSSAQFNNNILTVNGTVNGELLTTGPPYWMENLVTSIINLFTGSSGGSGTPQIGAHPLGEPEGSGSSNVPAYAWMQLVVPPNAVSMSFDYIIQGDWQSDSLAAAFNGTNVLLIAGSTIQTNATFSSGSIDVSAFAGQTNEFFIGIVGSTSTNAQLTVENLVFYIAALPSLQAQMNGNNLIASWPLSAASYVLETTTNLANTNSWTALTNVPAILSLQNTVTNSITGKQGFYRLIQSQ